MKARGRSGWLGRSAWWFPIWVFLLGALATLSTYGHFVDEAERDARSGWRREVAMVHAGLESRLSVHAQILGGMRAFLAASAVVAPEEWAMYAQQIERDGRLAGLQAYGFARRELNQGQNRLQAVFQRGDEAPPAWLAQLLTPVDLDLLLLQDEPSLLPLPARGTQAVVAMVLPTYRSGSPPATLPERRAAWSGILYLVYVVDDLLEVALPYRRPGLLLRVRDQDGRLLFGNVPDSARTFESRRLDFGERQWRLEFLLAAPPGAHPVLRVLLAAGLLCSVLLALMARAQIKSRQQAERRAGQSADALQHSQQRLHRLAAGSSDGLWDQDLLHDRLWCSERVWEMLGEPEGHPRPDAAAILARVHPEERAALHRATLDCLRGGNAFSCELRVQRADGRWAWFRLHTQCSRNAAGRVANLFGSLTDIGDEMQAARHLRYYRDFLDTVLRFIPHPVFVKNQRCEYLAVNAAFCQLTGRSESELIGQRGVASVGLPSELARQIREADAAVLAGAGERVDEYDVPFDCGWRRVIARKALAHDPEGEPLLIGTLTDVSELRQAERERSAADRQRQEILDAATEVAIIATDCAGRITLFNRGAEKMLGYAAGEVVACRGPEAFLPAVTSAAASTGFAAFVDLPVGEAGAHCDCVFAARSGREIAVSLVVTAVRNEGGTLIGYLGVAVDVSERNAYAAELQRHRDHLQALVAEQTADLVQAKNLAERANEAKSEFLTNMSHEMRTPMHAVLGFARLGEERTQAPEQEKLRHYFARIGESGQRLLDLLNNLLDLSKFEAGMMRVEPRAQQLGELLAQAVRECEGFAAARVVHIELPEQDLRATVDGGLFGQLVRNLLSNAIKFSPEGGRIELSLRPAFLPRGRRSADPVDWPAACLQVRDHGPGIPAAELDSIFEKFVQSSETRTGAGGTGLGLSICRQIVLAHRGSIAAANHPEGGAEFTVLLPLELPAARQAQ